MTKTKIVKTLKKKLSDIVKYLEEAGMVGAKELRKAMDAIDGNFIDDEDYIVDSITSSIPDVQNALPGSMTYALHGGFGGRPSIFPGESVMIELASRLDKLGYYNEADELDEILREAAYDTSFIGLDQESIEKAHKAINMLAPSEFVLWEYEESPEHKKIAISNYIKDNDFIKFLIDNGYILVRDAGKIIVNHRNISPEDFGGVLKLAHAYDEYHTREKETREYWQQDTEPHPDSPHWGRGLITHELQNKPDKVLSSIIVNLIKMANKLDKSHHHNEVDEIDDLLKEFLSGEELEIIEGLEEREDDKKKKKVKPEEEEDKEGVNVLVQSNGIVPTSVSQTSGFSGLSDSYFYTSYRNLEAPYGG